MKWQQLHDKWRQCMRRIKQRWGGLNEDDFTPIDGRRNALGGKDRQSPGAAGDQVGRERPLEKESGESEFTCAGPAIGVRQS